MKPEMVVHLSCRIGNMGNSKYNIKLALEREQAVSNYLIGRGISAERLVVGESGSDRRSLRKKKGRRFNKRKYQGDIFNEALELRIVTMKK